MKLTLYTSTGEELFDIIPASSSGQDWSLMSDNKLSVTFDLETCVLLLPGCYVDFEGSRFYLLEEYKPTMINTSLWRYNVSFKDAASWMAITIALNLIDGQNKPIFNYTAPAAEHAAIIVANLNRRMNTTAWKVGSVIDTPNITIEYAGKYCSEILQEIVDGQKTEWWIDDMTLNIGRAEFGDIIELGYQQGLLGDIVCQKADDMRSYAYLYPVGSTRNIDPTKYGYDRLQLPDGQTRVDMNVEQGVAELVEEAAFSGIYPRYVGKVTEVSTSVGTSDNGSQYVIYFIQDDQIPFNPNDYELPGEVKHVTFQSGELMGADFEVNYNNERREFEIITQWSKDSAQLPGGTLVPAVGDEYVVWNITMPDEYYPLASQEFLEAAEAFAKAAIQDASVYKAPMDYIYVQEKGLRLRPGQRVRLVSEKYFSKGYYDSRVTRITRNLSNPNALNIDVSAVRVIGTIQQLQNAVKSSATQVTQISNTVQTVVRTVDNAVTLTGNQRVQGVKNFVDGIRLNGSPIMEYHPAINTWLFRGNILAEGGMAAFSNIKGFTPSTITDAVLIDNRTIKRGADGLLYVDFDEGGSGGGSLDEEQLEEYLKPYAKTADVANTYATKSLVNAISTQLNDFLSGSDTDTIINKWSELETFLAGLAETDDLATILSGKANKATTLAGYGITDAYTKSHMDSNFVTIGTKQEITGEKDFVGGFKVNGGLVEYNATLKTWVFNGDLLVTGGMSAFSNISGFKPSTITEAVLIDNKTIKLNADGLLYAVAQETDGINEEQLADYLTTNGYATQSWVTGRGYFLASNFTKANIKSALGISDWALASAKPTYTASEVGALAQDSSSTNADLDTILENKTAVLKPFFQSFTSNNIGSARKGVLRMAYNGSESQLLFDHYNRLLRYRTIGSNPKDWATLAFTSDIPTKLSQLTDDVVSGKYLSTTGGTVNGDITANNFVATNALKTNTGIRDCVNIVTSANYPAIAMKGANHTGGYVRLFNRSGADWAVTDENWNNSYTLLHSGNYSEYALPITGGTMTGSITTRTNTYSWNTAKTNGHIIAGHTPSVGFAPIISTGLQSGGYGKLGQVGDTFGIYAYSSEGTSPNVRIDLMPEDEYIRIFGHINPYYTNTYDLGDSQKGWRNIYATSFIGNLTGNADTATKLKNAVSLWGRTFDGTADLTGSLTVTTGEGYHINYNGYDLRFIISGSSKNRGIWDNTNNNWLMYRSGSNDIYFTSGNIGIGTVSPSEKLHVSGNILATGGITATNSSDRRLKRNIRKFNASKVLMSLGAVWEYEYIDSEVQKNHIYEGTHYGLIYQHVKGTALDVMCYEREDKMGALNYIHPKFISLIAGATMENISEVEKLKRKIRYLENKVKQLEQRS